MESTTDTTQYQELFEERYSELNHQIFQRIDTTPSEPTFIGQTDAGDDILIGESDVLAATYPEEPLTTFDLVLGTSEETGVTVYDLAENRYGYYPAEDLVSMVEDGRVVVLTNPLPITSNQSKEESKRCNQLLRHYDPANIPHIRHLPFCADYELPITDSESATVGDVIYTCGMFEIILGLSGFTSDEADSHNTGVVKYNLNRDFFGFTPLSVLQDDFNMESNETELISDPWNLRA